MKIIAIVVTYNRLELLKRCVQSVQNQTRKPDEIIIINNGSTDNTAVWLSQQNITTYTKENNGGAGGFSYGVKTAYNHGADWIWLMDDDTIPQPDALQKLLSALDTLGSKQEKVGFLSSTVLWTDGNPHEMNRTYPHADKKILAEFAFADEANLPIIQFGTFVSMLVSAKAVEKVGYPIKDFFIWADDAEYSLRIIGSGLAGLAVKNSIVTHETPTNHLSNVLKDPESAIWKYKHGLRNELYTKRLHKGVSHFWITWVHRMFIMPFRILINRKNHRWPFIKLIWSTSFSALFFNPVVEKADRRHKIAETNATANLLV